ncbi:unnamed protein product [Rhizophagus irregularis]|nr:unnamed protein product [Rhizophagus irregularis]
MSARSINIVESIPIPIMENIDVTNRRKEGRNWFFLELILSLVAFLYMTTQTVQNRTHYQSNGKLYNSYYNIISLGTYPPSPKFTQKPRNNAPQYPIPNNYIYAIQLVGKKDAQNGVLIVQNLPQAVANTFLQKLARNTQLNFLDHDIGLDMSHYIIFRLQIGSLPITTTATKVNERKRPLEDITSTITAK